MCFLLWFIFVSFRRDCEGDDSHVLSIKDSTTAYKRQRKVFALYPGISSSVLLTTMTRYPNGRSHLAAAVFKYTTANKQGIQGVLAPDRFASSNTLLL